MINKIDKTILVSNVTGTSYSETISLDGCKSFSAQVDVTVNTPSATTHVTGVLSTLTNQAVVYTSVVRGATPTISLVVPAAEDTTLSIEVVGSAVTVNLAKTSNSVVSTGADVAAALALDAPASALLTAASVATDALVALAATPLASGVVSTVNVTDNTLYKAAHGLFTGLKVAIAINSGTLPAGLTATTYYVIKVDADYFKLAASLADAIAGTAVDITDQGDSGKTITVTSASLAGGTVTLEKSNDDVSYVTEVAAQNITATATLWSEKVDPTSKYFRLKFVVTAGMMSISNKIIVKGNH